jgi:hypothetical protein
MSAWRIGAERSGATFRVEGTQPAWKEYVDRLVKYVPGDAIGGYTAVITIFVLNNGLPDPTLWLALLFLGITAMLVVLGWANTPGDKGSFGSIIPDIVLAVIAFVVWSLTVPGNGWLEIDAIGDNPEIVGVVGVVAGILMPLVAGAFGRD